MKQIGPIRIPKAGTFMRNVLTLAGATAVSQVALLAIGPLLSRLYAPPAWGTSGLLLSFVAFASVATALCYDQAIVGSETDHDAAALTMVSLWIGPVISTVAIGLLWLFIRFEWLGFGGLPPSSLGWALVLLVLMQLFVSFRYWHMREERFSLLARTTVTQNIGRAVLPAGAAAVFPGWVGLVAGETLGRGVGILPLVRERWHDTRTRLGAIDTAAMLAAAKRYSIFAYAGLPSSLLDAAAVALPLPIIVSLYGTTVAGQFTLAQRVLQAPAALVGRSIADAFHARLALHARERKEYVPAFFLRTAGLLLGISVVPAFVVLGLGARGFTWIFGDQWSGVGPIAVLMLPWSTAQLVVSPLSRAVFVIGGQRPKLVYDIVSVLLVLCMYLFAKGEGWSVERAVLWLSLGQALAYVVYFLILWRLVRRS